MEEYRELVELLVSEFSEKDDEELLLKWGFNKINIYHTCAQYIKLMEKIDKDPGGKFTQLCEISFPFKGNFCIDDLIEELKMLDSFIINDNYNYYLDKNTILKLMSSISEKDSPSIFPKEPYSDEKFTQYFIQMAIFLFAVMFFYAFIDNPKIFHCIY